MKTVIHFHIYKGDSFYIAESSDLPLVTQGATLDELHKNLEEAISLYVEEENLEDYDIASNFSVMANLELNSYSYA